jgi:hypothetical protein
MNSQAQIATDEFCRGVYPKTKYFFNQNGVVPKLGFKILNGPPIRNAPYLFIGYQPGGREEDHEKEAKKGTDKGWPEICEYATETQWKLVRKMQQVFEIEVLKKCVGTNMIFLRYPNAIEYKRDVGSKRKVIEKFCKDRVCEIVEAIDPQRIVTIGFDALQMFGPAVPEPLKNRRTLTKIGKICGRDAIGIIHLGGAWISNYEIGLLSQRFK